MIIVTYATPHIALRTSGEYTTTRLEVDEAYVDPNAESADAPVEVIIATQTVGVEASPVEWVESGKVSGYAVADGYEFAFIGEGWDQSPPALSYVSVPTQPGLNPTWPVTTRPELEARMVRLFGFSATTAYPTRTVVREQIPEEFWTRHKLSRETI